MLAAKFLLISSLTLAPTSPNRALLPPFFPFMNNFEPLKSHTDTYIKINIQGGERVTYWPKLYIATPWDPVRAKKSKHKMPL